MHLRAWAKPEDNMGPPAMLSCQADVPKAVYCAAFCRLEQIGPESCVDL